MMAATSKAKMCCTGGVCGSADANLVVFQMDLHSCALAVKQTINMQAPGSGDIAIRPDQRIFAVAGWNGKVSIYHRHKRRLIAVLQVRMQCIPA